MSKNNAKYRQQVLDHYNNRCACCGESIPEFLTVDHIGGGGTQHRKELGWKTVCQWAVENDYPDNIRVLCMNCNFATRHGKACPHERERDGTDHV